MKKDFVLIVVIALFLVTIGCAPNPKSLAEQFAKASARGDIARAEEIEEIVKDKGIQSEFTSELNEYIIRNW